MEVIKAGIVASAVVNFDETGIREGGRTEMAAQCFNRELDLSIRASQTRHRRDVGREIGGV